MKNKIKNIGFILCVLMVLTIKINVKAIKVMECDYTNEFKKYMKLSNEVIIVLDKRKRNNLRNGR